MNVGAVDRKSLFDWPNRVALAVFLFVFAKGIIQGNSFGGFVLGIASGIVWWLVMLALVLAFRLLRGPPGPSAESKPQPTAPGAPATSPYLLALRELEEEHPDEATLAEAYAVSDGDPDRTRAAYLRLRAQQLGKA